MPSKSPLDGEEEEEEEFREISFGYTGGVFYPFERAPFREEEEEKNRFSREQSVRFYRLYRPLVRVVVLSTSKQTVDRLLRRLRDARRVNWWTSSERERKGLFIRKMRAS